MKIARYRMGRRVGYGIVEDGVLYAAQGQGLGRLRRAARIAPVDQASLLPPTRPSKIVAVGKNYLDHAQEMGSGAPQEPLIFLKATSALIGDGDPIVIPKDVGRVDYEGELVAVIGRRARNLTEAQALDAVAGYTCGIDVTARDLQSKDGQWTRAKSFDTFASVGPVIETAMAPGGRRIRTRLNGRVV
ncbi:MAG: fumarylacetoacetate hydrolase family protein, partial [Dehalococcoidia bacterium]